MAFDSICVRFKNVKEQSSFLANARTVPFVESYFSVIKSCVEDICTEYFWVFASFIKLDSTPDILDYIPEQHEKDQIHVWYTTHPKGGLNKEGNVFLIPTKAFKKQMYNVRYLRDYKDINYHAHPFLEQSIVGVTYFDLNNPFESYKTGLNFYQWMINKDLIDIDKPNFYPSYWEDEKIYTFGKTKDIMLVPWRNDIEQFYDIERSVHYDYDYKPQPMDIIFISYDEPSAEKRFNILKEKFPRAKWSKNIKGQTLAYHTAAQMSETDYFFAVFPKTDIVDSFKFDFQPDRMKNPCHYIFDCYNPVVDLTYGHGGTILYNKQLVLTTFQPGLDFTLSQPHDVVSILSTISNCNETPLLGWRTSFREVIKLLQMKPTVESRYRLKKWNTLGKGENAEWVHCGAIDGTDYFNKHKNNQNKLMYSYDFVWLKDYFKSLYPEQTLD